MTIKNSLEDKCTAGIFLLAGIGSVAYGLITWTHHHGYSIGQGMELYEVEGGYATAASILYVFIGVIAAAIGVAVMMNWVGDEDVD